MSRIGAGREMPSPGDVVTGVVYGREVIGRVARIVDRGSMYTVRLDNGETVVALRDNLTIVDRYTGPASNVVRMADGWRFRDTPLTREEVEFWDEVRREKAIERAL